MLKTMGWKAAVCMGCLVVAGAYGCGDDGASGSSNNGGANNGASSDTSSFETEVETEGGTEQHSGQQKDEQAGENSWGATIAGNQLHLTLMSQQGTVISAVVETSETKMAPGNFVAGDTIEGTYAMVVSATAGNSFMSTGSGTITLDSCPRKVGDHATGTLNGIELAAETGNATWTLDGSFDVAVYAKSGDLFCQEESGNNDPGNNDPGNNDNPGGQCRADWCVEEGVCCPYMDCIGQCEFECFQSAECQGGLNPQACAECANGCLDECDVSSECRTAFVDLNTCGQAASCDETADQDAEQECLEENCCTEVNAAF